MTMDTINEHPHFYLLHCRFNFLAAGRTFTKETFKLTILMAAFVDAENHAGLVAWVIVEDNYSTGQSAVNNNYQRS